VQEFGMIGYTQWRIGAHVTGMRHREYEWSVAGDLSRDTQQSAGFYARLGLATRAASRACGGTGVQRWSWQ
jgi:cellulose biosynthesis protein BcsS